jgi:hypothetical protein
MNGPRSREMRFFDLPGNRPDLVAAEFVHPTGQDTLRSGHVGQDTDGNLECAVAARRVRDADAGQP